jgi:hypothetical protein
MVGPGWKDSKGRRHNYTEENYEEELINDVDKRINGQLNLDGIETKENPKEEYQSRLFQFLTRGSGGGPLAGYIESNPPVFEELFERAVGPIEEEVKPEEEGGPPQMTQQEAEQASYGIPIPESQIEVVPNLNEDTILIRRKPRNWTTFIVTKTTRDGQTKTYERYRDKRTGRFIKRPQITESTNMRVL